MTNWVDNKKRRKTFEIPQSERERETMMVYVVRWLYEEPQINSLVFLLLESYGEISLSNVSTTQRRDVYMRAKERERSFNEKQEKEVI
jgi:hypothetical protein